MPTNDMNDAIIDEFVRMPTDRYTHWLIARRLGVSTRRVAQVVRDYVQARAYARVSWVEAGHDNDGRRRILMRTPGGTVTWYTDRPDDEVEATARRYARRLNETVT